MTFDLLLDQVLADAPRFGHREHVHLTWLAVRAHGVAGATQLVSDGIQRMAPQQHHATITRAWVELVGFHVAAEADFDTFLSRNPPLLDKGLLLRFYQPATLASAAARQGWMAPDKEPFPT
jgi:hypothetical protein